MRTLIVSFFLGIVVTNAQNLEPSTYLGDVVRHEYYSISYVEEYEQAEWTFHMICKDCFGAAERKNNFRKDPSIKTTSALLSDYKGSGYDRGHLVPAGDMTKNELAMSESFYMSNMSPQSPSFNRGIWRKLESQIRNWSYTYDTTYVVTGPILNFGYSTIGDNKVAVPQLYYKVIYLKNRQKMVAYILPNEGSKSNLSNFQVTVDEVEQKTMIDFFPRLEDALETQLESSLITLKE
jgi:endonuclease G